MARTAKVFKFFTEDPADNSLGTSSVDCDASDVESIKAPVKDNSSLKESADLEARDENSQPVPNKEFTDENDKLRIQAGKARNQTDQTRPSESKKCSGESANMQLDKTTSSLSQVDPPRPDSALIFSSVIEKGHPAEIEEYPNQSENLQINEPRQGTNQNGEQLKNNSNDRSRTQIDQLQRSKFMLSSSQIDKLSPIVTKVCTNLSDRLKPDKPKTYSTEDKFQEISSDTDDDVVVTEESTKLDKSIEVITAKPEPDEVQVINLSGDSTLKKTPTKRCENEWFYLMSNVLKKELQKTEGLDAAKHIQRTLSHFENKLKRTKCNQEDEEVQVEQGPQAKVAKRELLQSVVSATNAKGDKPNKSMGYTCIPFIKDSNALKVNIDHSKLPYDINRSDVVTSPMDLCIRDKDDLEHNHLTVSSIDVNSVDVTTDAEEHQNLKGRLEQEVPIGLMQKTFDGAESTKDSTPSLASISPATVIPSRGNEMTCLSALGNGSSIDGDDSMTRITFSENIIATSSPVRHERNNSKFIFMIVLPLTNLKNVKGKQHSRVFLEISTEIYYPVCISYTSFHIICDFIYKYR